MTAKSKTISRRLSGLESCQLAQLGILPVRANHPLRRNDFALYQESAVHQARNPAAPMQRNSTFRCAIHQPLMQHRAGNAVTDATCKAAFDALFTIDKADASKWRGLARVYLNAQGSQCRQAVRHDAFTTGFVDGRPRAIDDSHFEARLPGGNGSRKSGGTSAGNQNFCFSKVAHITSAVTPAPSRIPGPLLPGCSFGVEMRRPRLQFASFTRCLLPQAVGGTDCLTPIKLSARHEVPISCA